MAAIAIAVSFFIIIVAVAVSAGFRKSVRDGVAAMTGDVRIAPYVSSHGEDPVPMPRHLPSEEAILAIPGVEGITPVAVRAGIVSQAKDYRWVWQRQAAETEVFSGCLPMEGLARRVAQISEGKIYGSEEFLRRWIVGLGSKFNAARVLARAVGEIGYSSHGWRIAAKAEKTVAAA